MTVDRLNSLGCGSRCWPNDPSSHVIVDLAEEKKRGAEHDPLLGQFLEVGPTERARVTASKSSHSDAAVDLGSVTTRGAPLSKAPGN